MQMPQNSRTVSSFQQIKAFSALTFNRTFRKSRFFAIFLLLTFGMTVLNFYLAKLSSGSSASANPVVVGQNNTSQPGTVSPISTRSISFDVSALSSQDQQKLAPFWKSINASQILNYTVPSKVSSFIDYSYVIAFVFNSASVYKVKHISMFGVNNLYYCISNTQLCKFESSDLQKIAAIKFRIDQLLAGSAELPSVSFSRTISNEKELKNSKMPLNFFFPIFFLVLGGPFVSALLEDNKNGLKFGLFMTGLRRPAYYIGLFSLPIIITFVYCMIVVFLTIGPALNALVPLLIITLSSGFAHLGVFWLIGQFASTERNANVLISLYSIIGLLGCTPLMNDMLVGLPSFVLLLLCINPVFGYGAFITIVNLSPYGTGFSELSVPFGAPSVNLFVLVSFLFTKSIILLACYLDWLQVSQDERRSFLYPLYKLFFNAKHSDQVLVDGADISPMIEVSEIDQVPETEKISISNLSKLYNGASTYALSNVSLEFAKGEIFGLMGYNGAGKSTLINILCGILSPSDGSISVFGKNPIEHRQEIAIRTGICQQQDILFEKLTAKEHLYYFGLLRGVSPDSITSVTQEIIQDLQMDETMLNSPSSVLSGGQKRKLCVALAYINDPNLVILDEMSSGVDPENRRVIWEFLVKKREGRATLLCTHFMDEADLVTGRKAMLTLGRLVCLGSSAFLKQKYDIGYTLSIETTNLFNGPKLDFWFREKQIQCLCKKTGKGLVEYVFRADQIEFLAKFESEREFMGMYTSYSIKENGLDEIFSSPKLLNDSELRISSQHKEKILSHFLEFKDPSLSAKTFYLLKFEFRRAVSTIFQLLIRLCITAIVTGLCCYFLLGFNDTKIGNNVLIPIDESFFETFIPRGLFFTTNMPSLMRYDYSKFSKVNNGVLGSIMQQPNGSISVILMDGFAGNGFLAVNGLLSSIESGIKSTYEYVPSRKQNSGSNIGVLPIIMILLAEALIYLAIIMVDEVAESRQQLKFLLLSFGIPLASYWIVLLLKLFLVALPFLVALALSVPSNFLLFDASFVVFMVLLMIVFSAFLASATSISTSRAIMKGFQYGITCYLIFVPVIVFSLNMPSNSLNYFGTACLFIGPFIPIAPFFKLLSGDYSSSKTPLLLAALGNLVFYSVLLILVELRHLFIKNIKASANSAYVQFSNVSKSFTTGFFRRTTTIAVNDLNLAIDKNELFALIGPNGCGKTTSLSMLTAQQLPKKGSIHMSNIHVASKKLDAIRNIGYCPQFDDLLVSSMTVSEHLNLFCTMNGISLAVRDEYIALNLQAFGIERFHAVQCGSLSGGTKRKVSAALAVMLPRSLVVLDEASTGLDPLARIKLWNAVKLLNRNRTTIMTTHYINETSACDRIAIMTAGQIQCCDTEHELAKKSEGYQLTVRRSANQHVNSFLDIVSAKLFHDDENARVSIDSFVGDVLVVHLTHFQTSIGRLVDRLVEMRRQDLILDFQVGRMSLEHVFLNVIKSALRQ